MGYSINFPMASGFFFWQRAMDISQGCWREFAPPAIAFRMEHFFLVVGMKVILHLEAFSSTCSVHCVSQLYRRKVYSI
jgi:hypothetical protein